MPETNLATRIHERKYTPWYEKYKVDIPEGESGPWRIERFEASEGIGTLRAEWEGRPIDPGTYTRLMRGGTLVMSDTPAEIRDHRALFRNATGRVLIHGLGLGVALRGVLLKDDVTHVDVVEIDEDLISLVAPHLEDPRVHIHHGDALTFEFPKGITWNAAWHDIWDDICADNLPAMKRLHRRYGSRCNWQASWCRHECENGRWS